MKTKTKIILAVSAVLIAVVLFVTAFTDKIFFTTLHLDAGEQVDNRDGSVKVPFYLYKDAWGEYKANIVTLNYDIKRVKPELVMFTLRLTPSYRYYMDSLSLRFYVNNVYSNIIFEDPSTGNDMPYKYELSGDDSLAILEFPSFDVEAGESISIRLWLDFSQAESSDSDGFVLMDFSMHENSVFKIARHTVEEHVLQFVVPN
jgi:hypothetical protein